MNQKTTIIKEDEKKQWFLIDATGVRVGKLASFVAKKLQGKHKSTYIPFMDSGDYIVIINAKNVDVNKNRLERKKYWRHTGYPGGIKSMTLQEMLDKKPEKVIEKAVWGMMPKTKLGRKMLKKLFVFADEKHSHEAQKPTLIEID